MDSTGINDHTKQTAQTQTGDSQYAETVQEASKSGSPIKTALGRFKAIRDGLAATAREPHKKIPKFAANIAAKGGKAAGRKISGAAGQAYADFMGEDRYKSPMQIEREGWKKLGRDTAQSYRMPPVGKLQTFIGERRKEGREKKEARRAQVKQKLAFGGSTPKTFDEALNDSAKQSSTKVEKFLDWQYK